MRLTHLTASAALSALLAGAPVALAASDSDLQGVESAKMTLSQAIMAAQKSDNGKAIFAKYETHNGVGNYVVTIVGANGQKDTVNVDPQTGQATKAAETSSGSSSQAGAQTIENAKVGLTQAIQTAEAKGGGKAMRATLDTEKGKTAYKIELANGNKSDTVWVDANSGSIINRSS
ncbi:MAG TPA: PepSY domain-containing protein [Alphaproteobacteria bacterium]|nr:PepSY domain-containing protein [Alphaproteobacteria bacterium]